MTKAKIIVIDGGTYGSVNFTQGEKIEVQFNPTEYSISTESIGKTKYKGDGGEKKAIHYDFKISEPRTLHVKLLYDTALQGFQEATKAGFQKSVSEYDKQYKDKMDVNRQYIRKLTALLSSGGKSNLPPRVVFTWGSISFRGYVLSMQVSYQRFSEKGEPTRAEIDLTIREIENKGLDAEETSKKSTEDLKYNDEPMDLEELFY